MPQAPQAPWTETAPTGSSTLSFRSTKKTLAQHSTPATNPIIAAPNGLTNAQDAEMATSPPSSPFAIRERSGLPYTYHT